MKKLFLLHFLIIYINAYEINDFIDLKKCDQVIDKQVFKICYSYKNKGALAVWYSLKGNLVNKLNIKKRPSFYSEKTIPVKYRSKSKDYLHSGFDRGHLANDASFDYDKKVQIKTYSMANIIPQYPKVNRKTWIKAEKYERKVATKLKDITVINLVDYSSSIGTIGKNKIAIPNSFTKILFNNRSNFIKCFKYNNIKNINVRTDKLKQHQINCNKLKRN